MSSRLATTLLLAALIGPAGSSDAQPAATPGEPPALLEAFQDTLTRVIAEVEPSVVAVLRSPSPSPPVARSGQQSAIPAQQPLGQPIQAIPLNNGILGAADPFAMIREPDAAAQAQVKGAGVVIDPSGLILTQYLVVKPGELHYVATTDGRHIPAEIVGADPRSSLAVLRARTDTLTALPLGAAEELKKGSLVIAVGNPFAIDSDGQATASYGMVSNLAQKAPAGENLNDATRGGEYLTTLHHLGTLIQTDAKLGWNASGGALVNLRGELVGVTTTVASIAGHEQPAGYAIPINQTMRRVIEDLKAGREVEYGLLGIGFRPGTVASVDDGATGVEVTEVHMGAPADRAGLQVGDVLVSIGEQTLDGTDQLQLVVGGLPPGVKTPIQYVRGDERLDAVVKLDKIFVPGEKVVTADRPTWQGIRVDYATAVSTADDAHAAAEALIDREGCVAVVEVSESSISWRRGVRPGMFISHVSGQRVTTPDEFYNAVTQAGASVKLRFTPGSVPQEAPPAQPAALPR